MGAMLKCKSYYDNKKEAYNPDKKIECLWFYGEPATGKTTKAWEENPLAYSKPANSKWFCGYDNEKTVIIDDMTPEAIQFTYTHLLKWGDKFPHKIEAKGLTFNQKWDKLIVTSNYTIKDCIEGMTSYKP